MARTAACLFVFGVTVLFWHAPSHAQPRDAAPVLAATREALGGEKNLNAVKTFVVTGRTRQLRGENLVPIEFEIACELPDKYVRKDEFPAQDTDVTVAGFRGDEMILGPQPPAGRGGPPPAQRLKTIKEDFARLMLGVFAASLPAYPLTFKYAAEGEAPEGKADILDAEGPASFAVRFVVQRETHLPVMLMWQAPGARGGAPTDMRLYFADYREVKGTKWPFRLRRAAGGTTTEEMTFDRVNVNVRIDPKKFEAPK
jgi:hypothetical protein